MSPLIQEWLSAGNWLTRLGLGSTPKADAYHRAVDSFSRYPHYLEKRKIEVTDHTLLFNQAIAESRLALEQLTKACLTLEPEVAEPPSLWDRFGGVESPTTDEPKEIEFSPQEAKSQWRTVAGRVWGLVEKMEILLHGEKAFADTTMPGEVFSYIHDLTPPDKELVEQVNKGLTKRIKSREHFLKEKKILDGKHDELVKAIDEKSRELDQSQEINPLVKAAVIAELKIKKEKLLSAQQEFEAAYFRATDNAQEKESFDQWEKTLTATDTFLTSTSFYLMLTDIKKKTTTPVSTLAVEQDLSAVETVRLALLKLVNAYPKQTQRPPRRPGNARLDKGMQACIHAYDEFTKTVASIYERHRDYEQMTVTATSKVKQITERICRSKDILKALDTEVTRLANSFAGGGSESKKGSPDNPNPVSPYIRDLLSRRVLHTKFMVEKQRLKCLCDQTVEAPLIGMHGNMVKGRQLNLSTRLQLLEADLQVKLAEAKYQADKPAPVSNDIITTFLGELNHLHHDIDQLESYQGHAAKTSFAFIELCLSEMKLATQQLQFLPYFQTKDVEDIFSSLPDISQRDNKTEMLQAVLNIPKIFNECLSEEEQRIVIGGDADNQSLLNIYKRLSETIRPKLQEQFNSFVNFQRKITPVINEIARQMEIRYAQLTLKPAELDATLTKLATELMDPATPVGQTFATYLELMKESPLQEKGMLGIFFLYREELKEFWQNRQNTQGFPNTFGLNPYEHAPIVCVQRLPRWSLLLNDISKASSEAKPALNSLKGHLKQVTAEGNETLSPSVETASLSDPASSQG